MPDVERTKTPKPRKRRNYKADYDQIINYCEANLDLLEELSLPCDPATPADLRLNGRIDALTAIIKRFGKAGV